MPYPLQFTNKLMGLAALALVASGCNSGTVRTLAKPAPSATNYSTPLHIGQETILVEIANTDAARQQGLSGRPQLADNQGMLFDFGTDEVRPGFWMKDMKFNLDFVWIDRGRIVDITPNVPAPQATNAALPVYYPSANIEMVLETNAGWSAAHNIKVGDAVGF